jgi:hypothetical protein
LAVSLACRKKIVAKRGERRSWTVTLNPPPMNVSLLSSRCCPLRTCRPRLALRITDPAAPLSLQSARANHSRTPQAETKRSVKQPRSDPLRFGCRVPLPARHPHVTVIDQQSFPNSRDPGALGVRVPGLCRNAVHAPWLLRRRGCCALAPAVALDQRVRRRFWTPSRPRRASAVRRLAAARRSQQRRVCDAAVAPIPTGVSRRRPRNLRHMAGRREPLLTRGTAPSSHRRYKDDLSRTEEWSTEASFVAEDESVQALRDGESDDVEMFDDFRAFPPPAGYSRATSWEDQAFGTTSRTTTPVTSCTSTDAASATVGERYLPDHGRRLAGPLTSPASPCVATPPG